MVHLSPKWVQKLSKISLKQVDLEAEIAELKEELKIQQLVKNVLKLFVV